MAEETPTEHRVGKTLEVRRVGRWFFLKLADDIDEERFFSWLMELFNEEFDHSGN